MENISFSVGKEGRNQYKDVTIVQHLINGCLQLLAPMHSLEPDGKIGPKTISAIIKFQHNVLKMDNPDGRVDPHGKTLRGLNHYYTVSNKPVAASAPTAATQTAAYEFPFKTRPAESYKTGMRRFGSNRKKGRLHAGCDLYAPVGTAIYAMDDGEVLKDVYFFYLGTYALEVKHTNFVARYGEIKGVAAGIKKGTKIKKGQLIAYVGELKGLNMSMLHLELYSGTGSGPLTVRGNKPYQRRSDLIDPTSILDSAV